MKVTVKMSTRKMTEDGAWSTSEAFVEGRVPDLRMSDLQRLFEAERAFNELTSIRVHVNLVEDGEVGP